MNAQSYLTMLMSSLAMQLPILLVCLGGGAMILVRWKQMGRSGVWALLGFGLGAILCLLVPAVQAGIQAWAMENGGMAQRAWVFSALSVVWAIFRATSYAMLLVAILVGRGAEQSN
jgi:ABC-type methionine transport system permease subunit